MSFVDDDTSLRTAMSSSGDGFSLRTAMSSSGDDWSLRTAMSGSEDGSSQRVNSEGAVKRSLSATPEGPAKKRAHVDGPDHHFSIKILVPSIAVGAIIGKGGDVMRTLKTDHSCIVHMSKSGDTFPGTSERICTIKGRFANVASVISIISGKIHEKCGEMFGTDGFDFKDTFRGLEMKIVVPNTSAGIVIGKSGATIKDIRDNMGCQIQVQPKSGTNEANLSKERIVVIAHTDLEKLIETMERVLERVAADPHHASEMRRDESHTPKFVTPQSPANSFYGGASSISMSPVSHMQMPPPIINRQMHPAICMGNHEVIAFLDSLQRVLRESGFNEPSVAEVMGAMQVLAKYNIMAAGLGFGVQVMGQMKDHQSPQNQRPPNMNYSTNHGAAGFGASPQQQQQYNTSEYWRKTS